MRSLMAVAPAFLSVTLISACHPNTAAVGTVDHPVVFMISPSHGKSGAPEVAMLQDHLRQSTGLHVDVRVAESPVAAMAAFEDGKAHVGLLTVFEYLLVRREYGAHARLQLLGERGPTYMGELLVRADSNMRSVQDLQGRKVALVDAYSMSGHLLVAKLLADADVKVQQTFAGSHENSLAMLKAGLVDAAASYHGVAKGDLSVRAIATTPPIPREPVFVHPRLDVSIAERLTDALTRFATTPQGITALSQLAGITGFQPVTDDAYRGVSKVVTAAGYRLEDLVPGSLAWAASNREPLLVQ